jgi:hypothetical protein
VSCGTSLQVLRKNGIAPDFHAEIEQNRTTFDWAARVGDFEFLKNVSLISCNGIHPDTCDLYKDVLIAFKEGESSTVSTLKVLGEDKFETLKFAFPTVTNFALNFFIKLGFNQLYLIGVDLGFANTDDHHSKQSGYYDEKGNPFYDYAERNNISLVTPGNFRTTVFTKQEFKIARIVMEQSLASSKVDCYNTSDGAKIAGSMSLPLDDILLLLNNSDKQSCLANMRNNCFAVKPKVDFIRQYKKVFSEQTLRKEMSMFRQRIAEPVDNFEQAELLIETQKTMYQHSDSLLFYLLYGTVNYANVVLNKVAYSLNDGHFSSSNFNQARELWLKYYDKISSAAQKRFSEFDSSTSFTGQRMISLIKRACSNKKILILSESASKQGLEKLTSESWISELNVTFLSHDKFIKNYKQFIGEFDYIIYNADSDFEERFVSFEQLFVDSFSDAQILCLTKEIVSKNLIAKKYSNICFFHSPGDFAEVHRPCECNVVTHFTLCFLYLFDIKYFDLLIPKYSFSKNVNMNELINTKDYAEFEFYDLNMMLGVRKNTEEIGQKFMLNGTRTSYLGEGLTQDKLNLRNATDEAIEKTKRKFLATYPYLLE